MKRTEGHEYATAKSGFVMDDSEYPKRTKGFLFFILSDQYPDTTFNNDAVVSAAPSTMPTAYAPAPRTVVKNRGTRGKTIWLLKSVKRLTNPRIMIFDVSPLKKFFLNCPLLPMVVTP